MFILKKGHKPGVYVPLRALFLVSSSPNLCELHYLGSKVNVGHFDRCFIM